MNTGDPYYSARIGVFDELKRRGRGKDGKGVSKACYSFDLIIVQCDTEREARDSTDEWAKDREGQKVNHLWKYIVGSK